MKLSVFPNLNNNGVYDLTIKVVKYLQEKGTFKVKGAIVLVAEKLAVSEPTIYRYLKKMQRGE